MPMNITFPLSPQASSVPSAQSCKAAIFKISGHWLALPATTILKIMPSSALGDDQTSQLTIWDHQPLVRLNLHQLLTRTSIDQFAQPKHPLLNLCPYTMIAWSQTGTYCGIPVDELPVLHELSLSKAQVLPSRYRQSICNIAKYLVIQPYQGTELNILLLDLQQALNSVAA